MNWFSLALIVNLSFIFGAVFLFYIISKFLINNDGYKENYLEDKRDHMRHEFDKKLESIKLSIKTETEVKEVDVHIKDYSLSGMQIILDDDFVINNKAKILFKDIEEGIDIEFKRKTVTNRSKWAYGIQFLKSKEKAIYRLYSKLHELNDNYKYKT